MEVKKSPKADLEKGKGLSLLMGFVIALGILYVGFEWGSRDIKVATADEGVKDVVVEEEIEITRQDNTPPPPPPPPAAPIADQLNVVDDDIELDEQEIISSEDDQSQVQQQTYVAPAPVEEVEEEAEEQIFTVVEKNPEFPGGAAALMKYLKDNINYPVIAQENGIQGRVICQFVVNRDGRIVDAVVLRGVDPSLDKEALRVVNSMPKWNPGEQRGKPVRVRFTLPVQFKLE